MTLFKAYGSHHLRGICAAERRHLDLVAYSEQEKVSGNCAQRQWKAGSWSV